MSAASALRVKDLHVRYGDVLALRGLDLDVPPGGCTAVLGPSGCGKTTLLRAVAGLVRAQAGVIEIGGVVKSVVRPSSRIFCRQPAS